MTPKKIGRPPPEWLLKLEKGRYRLPDLVKKLKISKGSIVETLQRYGAEVEYIKIEKRIIAVYVWDGFKD